MDYRDLSLELSDGVALVTLNRPEKMNALGPRLVHERHDHRLRAPLSAPVRRPAGSLHSPL